ncbi:Type cbb3 cytochrome oxidase biogenesis protein CcoH [Paramagnetospirillum magnetotacticum MS-1]|uniref:Type cbb3 cytochrome oxidase biogenesis protein CcoH n=1 Tax=Paramagnetospirillum magnetotacticum MS-1 TaxID=272627 RepID=A0A0C2UYZ3_PARME|nr:FixH family protein [Paramagnetospirillum magnetotacticum]KIL98056.1 Type cbb3 cytochrome oxidase biogenesis protein CcoH [Paramagnetospirillum magnetotacticum MS-1]
MDMTEQRKPGWWYPYIFVGGFMVVLMVNLTMAYFANSTFSGISTERPYEKGLAFNQTLEMARKQEALNWAVDVQVEPAANHGAHITITYKDAAGHGIDGMEVKALFVRPTAKGHDREVRLAPVGPGTYATHQELPLAGVWDLTLLATGKEIPYSILRRIVVP